MSHPKPFKHSRRLRNFLVPGTGQLFYGLLFGGVAAAILLGALAATITTVAVQASADCGDAAVGGCVGESIAASLPTGTGLVACSVFAVVNVALFFCFGLVVSHRTFGPEVAIKRHVDALVTGNFAERIVLRRGDHHQELADQLNRLAVELERRYGTSGAA